MSKPFTVFCYGDSPACSFLSWRLSVGQCNIYIGNSKAIIPGCSEVYWTSQKFNDSSYKPIDVYKDSSNSFNCDQHIDFVLLSSDNIDLLKNSKEILSNIIDKDTIILADSTCANNVEDIVSELFHDNIVLSLYSEALVKITVYNEKNEFNHVGNKVATMIGSSSKTIRNSVAQTLEGISQSGKKLTQLIHILLSNGVFPCSIVQNGAKPTIQSHIWKNVMSFVTFDVLSLVYGELNTTNAIQNKIMRKCFSNILGLAGSNCKNEFPNIDDKSKVSQLFEQMMKDFNQKYRKYQISGLNSNNPSDTNTLEYPACIYNFLHNFDNYVPLCLTQIMDTSDQLKIEVPYIECIQSFYQEIEKIKNAKIYNWIKKEGYQPEKPKILPNSQIIRNISANSSSSEIFNQTNTGNSTPMTQLSNSIASIPQGYMYYPSPEGMIMVPNGKNYYPIHPTVSNADSNPNTTKKYVIPHPRFRNIPKEKINGRRIPFMQAKDMVYPTTKGSNAPSDLTEAHKHLYQYANLNNTFESVNNRYGWADSLNVFKESKGIKDKAKINESNGGDIDGNLNVSDNAENNQEKIIENVVENVVEGNVEYNVEDGSDNDEEMQDAIEKIEPQLNEQNVQIINQ